MILRRFLTSSSTWRRFALASCTAKEGSGAGGVSWYSLIGEGSISQPLEMYEESVQFSCPVFSDTSRETFSLEVKESKKLCPVDSMSKTEQFARGICNTQVWTSVT